MLSKIQIITLLQLKGIARKSVFKIANVLTGNYSDEIFIETLLSCTHKDVMTKIKEFSFNDIELAFRKARSILSQSQNEGIEIFTFFEDSFPQKLKSIQDPPIVLNFKGNLNVLNAPGIAIIGTREPSGAGLEAGIYFGDLFARAGFNVISGLALGCDAAAHKGALMYNGACLTAILAHGLHAIYPKSNEHIGNEILKKNGLLVSEYFINEPATKGTFVERDRLQAGLSDGTIVIQTGETGGTMHAVSATLNSGKPLAAVQYKNRDDLDHQKTQGNIKLINNGAFGLTSTNYLNFIATVKSKISNANTVNLGSNDVLTLFSEINNKKFYKGVIFDLDQTLVDSSIAQKLRNDRNWKDVYSLIPKFKLYDGFEEVFNELKKNKILIAIVTTSPEAYAKKVIEHFNIPHNILIDYFRVKNRKPHPEALDLALELLKLDSNEVISFGDRVIDIDASKSSGIISVGCTWGSSEIEDLKKSSLDHIIDKPLDILNLLKIR
jgi:DNA processing protein